MKEQRTSHRHDAEACVALATEAVHDPARHGEQAGAAKETRTRNGRDHLDVQIEGEPFFRGQANRRKRKKCVTHLFWLLSSIQLNAHT